MRKLSIYNIQNAQNCKIKSNAEKEEFSTYPHSNLQKTWKTKDFEKVIHIIHIKILFYVDYVEVKKNACFGEL